MLSSNPFKTIAQSIIITSTVISLSGCIIHVGGGSNNTSDGNSVSSVFGGLEVSQGKHVSNVSSVNGSIELQDDVNARTVDTVNGSIEIGNYVSVQNTSTVNGDIDAGHHFNSAGFVKTVNGDISLLPSSKVALYVETLNGDISLNGVMVEGSVSTHNGDITLSNSTQIFGDIVFHKNSRNSDTQSIPTLHIKHGANVAGKIILYREVELDIEDASLLNKVEFQTNTDK